MARTDEEFYDALEHRDPAQRRRALARLLPRQIAHAKAEAPYYARKLKGIDPAAIASPAALAALPLTRKSDLTGLQAAKRPLGGLNGWPLAKLAPLYQSPGPIYEADIGTRDYWRMGRALWAAGLRPGEIVHNSFSYHLTPAGMMVEMGAAAIGCPVVPAGTGNTEMQLKAIADVKPRAYAGTPSFLKILLERGREAASSTRSLKIALVGGEALPPSLRAEIRALGVRAVQNYGTADIGLIAYESRALDGMIIDEGVVVEIVRPGTGDPVADGEVGDVVVTSLSPAYPLVRFATGDLSAVLAGPSPCGRTNRRIKGWMGRADQTTKVKGMFVHPKQVAEVGARHPELGRLRLVVGREAEQDTMTLVAECAAPGPAVEGAVAETLQSVTKLKGVVTLVAPGSLPNDGKVIADERPVG